MIKTNYVGKFYMLLTMSVFIFSNHSLANGFNLDFEQVDEDVPVNWDSFGTDHFQLGVDNKIVQSGSYSAFIESHDDLSSDNLGSSYKAWSLNIPANYQGTKVKLTGYLKTENVRGGFAGLWLRVDPRLFFDNMAQRGITGTTDWQKFEIETELDLENASNIIVGGLLVGQGKIWLDNLSLTIDGIPVDQAPLRELTKAEKDLEFDEGSLIKINNLTDQKINSLTLLGKVWGFLKYHHPSIADAQFNWDYELFRFLPQYLAIDNNDNRDQLLLQWIESLGPVSECETCAESHFDAYIKPDYSWISNGLSSELKEKLKYIYENRNIGSHYYIGFGIASNANFKHENNYSNMPYPDDGFRLLAVYRFWNMIHYYFPYKYLTDLDWNHVLKTYIPRIINAKNELEYEQVISELIGQVNDSHATLQYQGIDKINETKGKLYPPVRLKFIGDELVVVDYYNPEMIKDVGLKIGDVITHINSQPVAQIVKEWKPIYPASNHTGYLRNISIDILRSDNKQVKLQLKRKSKTIKKTIPMFNQKELDFYYWYRVDADKKSYQMLANNIGYIDLKNIKEEDIEVIKTEMANAKGIVIDIRNYPNTFVPYKLGSFFSSTEQPFALFSRPTPNNPGEFLFDGTAKIPASTHSFQGPLVVLVDEITQSMAEFTTMAFQAGENTTVIGTTSAGADGNISSISLPGGLNTQISGLGVYYPDGTETQRVGVKIDHLIEPTIEAIRTGKDEWLEQAIEIINSKSAQPE